MGRSRNLADLLDANGDVALGNLDNVPPSNDASALTTGTLPIDRIADGAISNAKIASGVDASKLTTGTIPAARIADGSIAAGKLDTVYQTPLTAGTDYLAPNGDGSGLSGIASDALTSTFDIRSGESLGAGKAVSFGKSDSTVGAYPSTPTITEGTAASLSYSYAYTDRSGSTALQPVADSNSATVTWYSAYKSNNVWNAGSSTSKSRGYSYSNYRYTYGWSIPIPGADNAFFVMVGCKSQTGTSGNEYMGYQSSYTIATVNPSNGAISVGSWSNFDGSTYTNPPSVGIGCGVYVNATNPGIFYVQGSLSTSSQWRVLKIDGTSITHTTTTPSNMYETNSTNFTYHKNQYYKNSTLATLRSNDFTYRDVSWNGSSILTDMGDITNVSPTNVTTKYDFIFSKDGNFAIQLYKYVNNYYLRVFTTSFSGGTLTLTEVAVNEITTSLTDTFVPSAVYSITDTKFIVKGTYSSISKFLTFELNANGTLKGYSASTVAWDLPSTNSFGDITIGADESTVYADHISTSRRVDTLSIPDYYEPDPFTFIGFSQSSQTGSTGTVVTKGVASGFTGLTTGAKYYLSSDQDGTITTDSTQGDEVGTALSSTELLVK